MASGILVEADTVGAQDLSQQWFTPFMTDLRYSSQEFLPVYPTNALTNATQISFHVGAFTGSGALKLQDSMLFLKAKLTKSDGTSKVPDGKEVAPINLIAHSAFSSCSLYLNDQLINTSNELYNYKSYLLTMLTYGADSKFAFLQAAGCYPDSAGEFDVAGNSNSGFLLRKSLFLEDIATNKYHGEEIQFATRLFTDLVTTDTPLPPGISVRIILRLASNDFILQTPTTDDEKYKLVITDAVLHIPVATMTPEVYNRFERHISEKDAAIYFRRVEMSTRTIPKNTTVYNSETLFSAHANPCKLIVGLVDTKAYVGDYHSNPYNFKRKWTDDQGNVSFVESMSLTLDGKTLDGLESKATERSDTLRFLRLHHFLQTDNVQSNNITLDGFYGGFFLGVYDVSTSGHCGYDFLSPATRMGSLRLTIEFSTPCKEEITVILFSEFPSLIKINKSRQISLSYY